MALLVSQAVERLPAAEREAVVLYYFEGYAGDEAARFLDIPVDPSAADFTTAASDSAGS